MNKKSVMLAIAALAGVALTVSTAGPGYAAAAPGSSSLSSVSVARPAAGHFPHGLGVKLDRHRTVTVPSASKVAAELRALSPHAVRGGHLAPAAAAGSAAASASADLTRYAATPGDQGDVNSCVSWAIDHSAFSILENEQGISGGPQAPMYTYTQLVNGQNVGTDPIDTLNIARSQGVDSEDDYWQGDYDYWDQPTQAEQDNASYWRLSGYTSLHTGYGMKTDIQNALSNGEPVIVSIPYFDSFGKLTSAQATGYSYYPSSADQAKYRSEGYPSHEVTIVGYTSQGVTIENSWGTNWGDGGFATLPWSFITNLALDANALGALVQ